jgi:hypothetical protein
VLKGKRFSDVENIKSVKEILTDISVQDFKNCFEQNWREITLKNSMLLIFAVLKVNA